MSAHLERAVELAAQSAKTGGGPFGAVILLPDGSLIEGTNRVTADNDPTAHAEVSAIRAACAAAGTFDLSGAVLFSSCQPCPMCLTSALWARIGTIFYAASDEDAAEAGFDDRTFYEQLRGGLQTVTSAQVLADPLPSRLAPFEAWEMNLSRIDY